MSIIYNETDRRAEDTETGTSITFLEEDHRGSMTYLFNANQKAFVLGIMTRFDFDEVKGLTVPAKRERIAVRSFDHVVDWQPNNSVIGDTVSSDYRLYESIIESLLTVQHSLGDGNSPIEIAIDFSEIEMLQKQYAGT